MKRLHIHSKTADLDASIRFYSTLFGAEPSVAKTDYAKWMLDDPRVNFAVSLAREGAATGIEHLGIQAEDRDELAGVYGALARAGQPVLEEGETSCCYAKSAKSWTSDPDGVLWEAFLTHGESVVYGDPGPVETGAMAAAEATGVPCCVPPRV